MRFSSLPIVFLLLVGFSCKDNKVLDLNIAVMDNKGIPSAKASVYIDHDFVGQTDQNGLFKSKIDADNKEEILGL